jgi:hypothetical protein
VCQPNQPFVVLSSKRWKAAASGGSLSGTLLPCWVHTMAPRAGLKINDEGLLIDETSGQVINEYGATRFDVAVRGACHKLRPQALGG